MSVTCIDCGKPIKYGEGGWGGGNLHASCRGKRGAAAAKKLAEVSGKSRGDKRGVDPLAGTRRTW